MNKIERSQIILANGAPIFIHDNTVTGGQAAIPIAPGRPALPATDDEAA